MFRLKGLVCVQAKQLRTSLRLHSRFVSNCLPLPPTLSTRGQCFQTEEQPSPCQFFEFSVKSNVLWKKHDSKMLRTLEADPKPDPYPEIAPFTPQTLHRKNIILKSKLGFHPPPHPPSPHQRQHSSSEKRTLVETQAAPPRSNLGSAGGQLG